MNLHSMPLRCVVPAYLFARARPPDVAAPRPLLFCRKVFPSVFGGVFFSVCRSAQDSGESGMVSLCARDIDQG